MPEGVLGGGATGGRVGTEQGEAAERRLDRAAQTVVDPDALAGIGGDAGNFGAGRGVVDLRRAAGRGREQQFAAAVHEQSSVRERAQDRHGAGVAELAER